MKSNYSKIQSHEVLRGFTILESVIMLAILAVFSILTVSVVRKGITRSSEAEDPEWEKKGGDASMADFAHLPEAGNSISAPQERPGLGVEGKSKNLDAKLPPQ